MSEFWTLKQSHNHVMTGSIDAFFYKTLAGFNLDENYPGCERIIIKPFIPESLPFVKASIITIRGKVSVDWQNDNSTLNLKIEIPANMTGDIYIPVNKEKGDKLVEELISENQNIKFIGTTDKYKHFKVNSGAYEFVVKHGMPKGDK